MYIPLDKVGVNIECYVARTYSHESGIDHKGPYDSAYKKCIDDNISKALMERGFVHKTPVRILQRIGSLYIVQVGESRYGMRKDIVSNILVYTEREQE